MGRNASEIERAVARTLRDSLEKLQRTTDEVNQAVGDLVSACSSARPSNTLPHLLRAQTSAASLAATLDVLSRFITAAIQPSWNNQFQQDECSAEDEPVAPVKAEAASSEPLTELPAFDPSPEIEPAPGAVEEALRTVASETAALEQAATVAQSGATEVARQGAAKIAQSGATEIEPLPLVTPPLEVGVPDPADVQHALELMQQIEPQVAEEIAVAPQQSEPQVSAPQPVIERAAFDLTALPADQQELHRRANRVAKVSMQDIKMLRPADVRAGKENNDLCLRLRDDIERAHKEYERRFHGILDHPVDYFYAWMVEILGEGDSRALGEYPYPSAVARR